LSQIKPWHVVVLVGAAVALSASAYFTLGGGTGLKLANEMTVVDITTGDLYIIPLGGKRAVGIPGRNPESGKVTLLPVSKDESGTWTVSPRYLGGLQLIEGEPKALLDKKTGAVKVNGEVPKRLP
jgi:hypothetical protein